MRRALIVYYSFTSQTERAAAELEKTCIDLGWEARTCRLDFADGPPEFPLRPLMGRALELSLPSLLERPVPIRFDESVLEEPWDLVLIGSPTWLTSPARPVSSFLKTPAARHLLAGTPFGVFVVCRGFWRRNRARVRALGRRAGGRYVGGAGFGFDGHYVQTNKAFFAYHTSAGADTAGYGLSEATLGRVRAFGAGLLRELR
ncbi:MAG TPA: hypothetical protein VEN99_05300 [Acidimicrobiia bacterium]|nr:hypothetical protein [Acidimicrobiia bacterium]